jgi:protein CpxP
MKTKFGFLFMLLLAGTIAARAQGGGGFQMPSVEERMKTTMEKLAELKLDKDQTAKADSIFTGYYKAQNKMFEDMRAGGGQVDREKMRADRDKMVADRDEKLKKVFTTDQFKKFKDEIEPALSPRRGGNRQ